MKHLIIWFFSGTIMTNIAFAQIPNLNPQQVEIIALEKAFAGAIKTQDTLQTLKFLSVGFFLAIGVQGMPLQLVSRERWLSGLNVYVTDTFSFDDIKVNIYGNMAVVILLATQKATFRGQDRSAQFYITDIWLNENNRWLITERHSSRPEIPAVNQPK